MISTTCRVANRLLGRSTLAYPLLLGAVILASPCHAAERTGRLVVDLHVEGAQSWRSGQDYGKATVTEDYHVVTTLQSDGELSTLNPFDPGLAQKQMATAARVQRAVQRANGTPVTPAPANAAQAQAMQVEMMKKAEQQQTACAGNQSCLMQLAMQLAQQSAALSVPYGDPSTDSASVDDEEDARYLGFNGFENCSGQIEIRIDRKSEGAYADVAGMRPFSSREQAQWHGDKNQVQMQCLNQQTTYDTRSNKIYSYGFSAPIARGSSVHTDGGHVVTQSADTELSNTMAAMDWAHEQLRVADATGSASAVLPVESAPLTGTATSNASFDGQVKVSMKWRFEID